jgi:hypothetical protein
MSGLSLATGMAALRVEGTDRPGLGASSLLDIGESSFLVQTKVAPAPARSRSVETSPRSVPWLVSLPGRLAKRRARDALCASPIPELLEQPTEFRDGALDIMPAPH